MHYPCQGYEAVKPTMKLWVAAVAHCGTKLEAVLRQVVVCIAAKKTLFLVEVTSGSMFWSYIQSTGRSCNF